MSSSMTQIKLTDDRVMTVLRALDGGRWVNSQIGSSEARLLKLELAGPGATLWRPLPHRLRRCSSTSPNGREDRPTASRRDRHGKGGRDRGGRPESPMARRPTEPNSVTKGIPGCWSLQLLGGPRAVIGRQRSEIPRRPQDERSGGGSTRAAPNAVQGRDRHSETSTAETLPRQRLP
jgi:hypothetical protein